jgi:hypothetical protein
METSKRNSPRKLSQKARLEKEHHQTLITKAKELLDFANSGTVTITQGIDGVSIECKAKVTQANTLTA